VPSPARTDGSRRCPSPPARRSCAPTRSAASGQHRFRLWQPPRQVLDCAESTAATQGSPNHSQRWLPATSHWWGPVTRARCCGGTCGDDVTVGMQRPARPFPSSILLDKNRRDISKSQSIWTDSKMETVGSQGGDLVRVAEVKALRVGGGRVEHPHRGGVIQHLGVRTQRHVNGWP
jgi:hypothetical protein